jgi:hypothetical protein
VGFAQVQHVLRPAAPAAQHGTACGFAWGWAGGLQEFLAPLLLFRIHQAPLQAKGCTAYAGKPSAVVKKRVGAVTDQKRAVVVSHFSYVRPGWFEWPRGALCVPGRCHAWHTCCSQYSTLAVVRHLAATFLVVTSWHLFGAPAHLTVHWRVLSYAAA